MTFFSRLRTQILSWWQDTPLPAGVSNASVSFQSWHEYDEVSNRWRAVEDARQPTTTSPEDTRQGCSPSYSLVTWNVDYSSPFPGRRLSAILSHIFSLAPPAVDIIFLQELSVEAFALLLDEPRIRQGWFLSDADGRLPAGQSFTSITLISKVRSQSLRPGPVWRVKYPSRFQRDALCCDIFVPSTPDTPGTRVRLVNVHLDSLPIQPSLRPQQISIIAGFLRSAARGVVAGDFNPVLPTDDAVLGDNGLVDAWAELHPGDPGYTWGVDGTEPFPPNRMDKVATVGLRVQDIEILSPGYIGKTAETRKSLSVVPTPDRAATPGQSGEKSDEETVPCSDHSGLKCSFTLVGLETTGP